MATEHVKIAEIEKPDNKKAVSISETDVDQPIEHGDNAQIEIYSDMGRTRTGIQNSKSLFINIDTDGGATRIIFMTC